jgi:hypothetical protein
MGYFKSLLFKNQIGIICDVRSNPYSKYNSQFNIEQADKIAFQLDKKISHRRPI